MTRKEAILKEDSITYFPGGESIVAAVSLLCPFYGGRPQTVHDSPENFSARAGFLPGRRKLAAIVKRTVGTAARLFRGQPPGDTHVLIRFSSIGRIWFLLG